MLQRSYWLQGLVPGALVLKQSLGTTQDSIRLQKPEPCQKVLLIIKPLSAVQELSRRPDLVLSSSINAARLAPPNNSGSWSPPPSQAIMLFTLDDGHCEKGTSTPSSGLQGTGLGRTWTHKPGRATTTAILCNLLWIPAGAIHLTKMFDYYCYAYFCRAAYIFAHLSAKLSNFFSPPLCTRAYSRIPLVHIGSYRSVLPPVPTPQALMYYCILQKLLPSVTLVIYLHKQIWQKSNKLVSTRGLFFPQRLQLQCATWGHLFLFKDS